MAGIHAFTIDPFRRFIIDAGAQPIGELAGVAIGDSLEVIRQLPTGCVDLLFADPPYFLSNGGSTCRSGKRSKVDKGRWDASQGLDLDHRFQIAWLQEARRVLAPTGTIWVSATHHALFSVGFALQVVGFHVLNLVTWCKTNPPPNLGCRTFTHATEGLIWASPERRDPLPHCFAYRDMKTANDGKPMLDWWVMPAASKRERRWLRPAGHPTQKPEALLDRIILASSRPGELVLDPFMGSGTTGAMAVALGRRFLGVELDPTYARAASRRIAASTR